MKKTILSITSSLITLIFFAGCQNGANIKGSFNVENSLKTEISLIEISTLKETAFKENLVTVSDSGFLFNLDIKEPGLYGLYIKLGEGNTLTRLENILYLKPNKRISLEYFSGAGNRIECRLSDKNDKDNNALFTINKRFNEIRKDNFLNPPKNTIEEEEYLQKYFQISDSLLEENRLSPLVRKFIEFSASDTYNSELFRSSLRDLSKFRVDYYNDEFILNYPSSVQNIIAYLNVMSGLNPYSGKKSLEIISSQVTELEKLVNNKRVFDRTIESMLNSFIMRYRDTENFEEDKVSFSLIAEKTHNKELSSEIINSFANLKYTIPGADLPPAALINNDEVSLTLDKFKGKYILIDIWATWCVPCMKMIPHFKQLEKDYSGKKIEFVSICTSSKKDLWLEKIKSLGLTHNQLFDIDGDFSKMLNISAVPHFMLYDPQGKLIMYKTHSPDSKEIRELLDKLVMKF